MSPAFAQPNNEVLTRYSASNGKVYHRGDTIQLRIGSAGDGRFIYVRKRWDQGLLLGSETMVETIYAKNKLVIDEIKQEMGRVYFKTGEKFLVFIEEAIESCEVEDCRSSFDKYDKLLKLKSLLDNGALTQEEFNREKEKMLADN